MKGNTKTIIIILAVLALVAIALAIFLPLKSKQKGFNFVVFDTNNNYHYEVNEPLDFVLNDSLVLKNNNLVWHFGNGDTLMHKPRVAYSYNKPGRYLVTLTWGKNMSVSQLINVIGTPEKQALDSIPKINGVTEGYQGEELVFFATGPGIDSWSWEFGESGGVDSHEQQAIYIYEKPGHYLISLKTNTTEYPVYHEIHILPRFERIEETSVADPLSEIQEDLKIRLQAIVNTPVSNKDTYYNHVNYIKNQYLCDSSDKVVVIINGDKYNDFDSYCQGLHFLENGQKRILNIEDVKVDNIDCIKTIHVTQNTIEKK